MGPKQAWVVFSFIALAADIILALGLLELGYHGYPVALLTGSIALIYIYVLYKRYHVEVVPENDILQFDDVDDLRILSSIYGLDTQGTEKDLRERLLVFARVNEDNAFVWVAPRSVISLGSALEVPAGSALAMERQADRPSTVSTRGLIGGKPRSPERLKRLRACPICDNRVEKSGSICSECGADLEFYSALSESKVGKRLISEKADGVRRKLRYDVPLLGENR
jgi:hypothetical protein